ncbi:MAG TPA: leucyl aminopeptidase [Acidobacteriota bacterium]|nr:leucyl aminopeptidase [Acidobacteriota bacterium]
MQLEFLPEHYQVSVSDMLAYPVFEDEALDAVPVVQLNKLTRNAVRSVIDSGEFKPERYNTCRIQRPPGLKARNLLLVGAGKKAQFEPRRLREIAGVAVRTARSCNCKSVAFFCRGNHSPQLAARLAVEGALYANYEADFYKTRDRQQRDVECFRLLFGSRAARKDVDEGIRRGAIIGKATSLARTLVNEPSNVLTPSLFAERALKLGTEAGLKVRVMEREEMQKYGMNTLLAVSRGSDEPPKMIILESGTIPRKKSERTPVYALIGKGITFDSGGISLKPSDKMEEMKGDMAGGAAVLGAMIALAQLRPGLPVIGLIPAVENLPSGKAIKPGDIVTSYLGKTVEIINTDAEGRLILADAIAYARNLGATRIIDIATLTGACIVALGHVNAGMMGTDTEMIARLRDNCSITGEGLWQLPLDEEYRKAIRSDLADIKNVGNRWAGAITAAKFLQEFVEDTPWVHMDIAGVDQDNDGRPFAGKGGTGFGVRTLVQLLE